MCTSISINYKVHLKVKSAPWIYQPWPKENTYTESKSVPGEFKYSIMIPSDIWTEWHNRRDVIDMNTFKKYDFLLKNTNERFI